MRRSRLAQKLTAQRLRGICRIERKQSDGWVVIAETVRCDVEDRSASASAQLQADPAGAPTERVMQWLIHFKLRENVKQGDRLSQFVIPNTSDLPTMIVTAPWRDDNGDATDVIAIAEEQAVETEWITFTRYDQDNDLDIEIGTYPVSISWDAREPRSPNGESASGRYQFCTMTSAAPFAIEIGDLVGPVQGRSGGVVREVRVVVAGRREIRVEYDMGVAS